jgi:rhodanese-related sulfurtransferase/CBS domain-containing protein
MPTEIDRDHVQQLMAQGAQLVEVLPAEEYAEAHLPGALNLPLKNLNHKTVEQLERERPVIVYCYDFQCDLSPRSAARLESLSFKYVFDYAAGKRDWFAAGLPMEGELTPMPKAGAIARRDIPTCYPTELVDEVRERVRARGWKMCVVVNEAQVVLGRLRGGAWEAKPWVTVESVMENGPTTFRPDVTLEDLIERMAEKKVQSVLITNADGVLLGVLFKKDAEQRLSDVAVKKEMAYSGNGSARP